MQIIGIIIAAIIGYFMGKDAQSRGMNGWFWGISIFGVLIVFLPIYLMIRKDRIK
jgi:lipid-A-disaccharide synthase-like uncharacterized protein